MGTGESSWLCIKRVIESVGTRSTWPLPRRARWGHSLLAGGLGQPCGVSPCTGGRREGAVGGVGFRRDAFQAHALREQRSLSEGAAPSAGRPGLQPLCPCAAVSVGVRPPPHACVLPEEGGHSRPQPAQVPSLPLPSCLCQPPPSTDQGPPASQPRAPHRVAESSGTPAGSGHRAL